MMLLRIFSILFLGLGVGGGVTTNTENAISQSDSTATIHQSNNKCMKKINIGYDYNNTYGARHQKLIRSVTTDITSPFYRQDKEPKELILNNKYFGDIININITHPQNTTIGSYKDLSFTTQSPREIVEFLLNNELITTYRHLEARLCMTDEKESNTLYITSFDAEHDYCTNECTTEKYTFDISVDKNNGSISILSH